jgi:hypothetical protein
VSDYIASIVFALILLALHVSGSLRGTLEIDRRYIANRVPCDGDGLGGHPGSRCYGVMVAWW